MIIIGGTGSGVGAEVETAGNRLRVALATNSAPAQVGAVRMMSENDDGTASGTPYLISPEADNDYRLRIAQEALFDCETFNYTAQNTSKHFSRATTFTAAWSAGGLNTNSLNGVAVGSGFHFGTYAEFPILGATILYCEIEGAFSTDPVANTTIDFGLMRMATTVPYAPSDGIYFRLLGSTMYGILNSAGSETPTTLTGFTYNAGQKYQFIIAMHERAVEFWIDDVLYATVNTPLNQGQPCMSSSLPFGLRHAIVGGGSSTATSFILNDYTVSLGGTNITNVASTLGNRVYGSYQGLSGGTMGLLANYANGANPTPSVPATATAAANFVGLGGQFWETANYAANLDVIICSYQVPAGTVNVQGRRLVIRGVGLTSYVAATLTGGPCIAQYALVFGGNSVDQNATESAVLKKGRRVALSSFTQAITTNQAISTILSQPGGSYQDFGDAPIFVNPGEFVQLVKKQVGTTTSLGTIAHVVTFVYGWE